MNENNRKNPKKPYESQRRNAPPPQPKVEYVPIQRPKQSVVPVELKNDAYESMRINTRQTPYTRRSIDMPAEIPEVKPKLMIIDEEQKSDFKLSDVARGQGSMLTPAQILDVDTGALKAWNPFMDVSHEDWHQRAQEYLNKNKSTQEIYRKYVLGTTDLHQSPLIEDAIKNWDKIISDQPYWTVDKIKQIGVPDANPMAMSLLLNVAVQQATPQLRKYLANIINKQIKYYADQYFRAHHQYWYPDLDVAPQSIQGQLDQYVRNAFIDRPQHSPEYWNQNNHIEDLVQAYLAVPGLTDKIQQYKAAANIGLQGAEPNLISIDNPYIDGTFFNTMISRLFPNSLRAEILENNLQDMYIRDEKRVIQQSIPPFVVRDIENEIIRDRANFGDSYNLPIENPTAQMKPITFGDKIGGKKSLAILKDKGSRYSTRPEHYPNRKMVPELPEEVSPPTNIFYRLNVPEKFSPSEQHAKMTVPKISLRTTKFNKPITFEIPEIAPVPDPAYANNIPPVFGADIMDVERANNPFKSDVALKETLKETLPVAEAHDRLYNLPEIFMPDEPMKGELPRNINYTMLKENQELDVPPIPEVIPNLQLMPNLQQKAGQIMIPEQLEKRQEPTLAPDPQDQLVTSYFHRIPRARLDNVARLAIEEKPGSNVLSRIGIRKRLQEGKYRLAKFLPRQLRIVPSQYGWPKEALGIVLPDGRRKMLHRSGQYFQPQHTTYKKRGGSEMDRLSLDFVKDSTYPKGEETNPSTVPAKLRALLFNWPDWIRITKQFDMKRQRVDDLDSLSHLPAKINPVKMPMANIPADLELEGKVVAQSMTRPHISQDDIDQLFPKTDVSVTPGDPDEDWVDIPAKVIQQTKKLQTGAIDELEAALDLSEENQDPFYVDMALSQPYAEKLQKAEQDFIWRNRAKKYGKMLGALTLGAALLLLYNYVRQKGKKEKTLNEVQRRAGDIYARYLNHKRLYHNS